MIIFLILSKDIFIMAKLTQKTLMPNDTALGDLVHLVDVSDTSQSPQGSSYKYPMSQLVAFLRKAGIGNWQTAAPTVNDDVTQGYINGAFWFDEDAQIFYILNDNSAGAADWQPFSLQMAYDGGNVVNGNTITLTYTAGPDHTKIGIGFEALLNATGTTIIGIGRRALKDSTANPIIAIGLESGRNSSGSSIIGIGTRACEGNSSNNVIGIGIDAANDNSGINVVGIGTSAANDNTGNNLISIGNGAGNLNTGTLVVGIGANAVDSNTGGSVNAIGTSAGRKNTSTNSNFIGTNAGYDSVGDTGNTTSHGVTVFSPESIPSYADHTAALAALTVANGCIASQVYIYRNVATNAIGFVLPV